MIYKSVLIISDTHIPYHVPELMDYLTLLKKKFKPKKIKKCDIEESRNRFNNKQNKNIRFLVFRDNNL